MDRHLKPDRDNSLIRSILFLLQPGTSFAKTSPTMSAQKQKSQDSAEPSLVDKTKEVAQNVSHFLDETKHQVEEKVHHAAEVIDEKTTVLGRGLDTFREKAAHAQHSMEEGYLDKVSPALERAQGALDNSAVYLSAKSPGQMLDDLIEAGRRSPRKAAGILFGAGFMLARKLYRRS